MLTRPTERQVVFHHVGREEVFLVILPRIRLVSYVAQKHATRLLVSLIKEPCAIVAWVRLEIKKEIDLVGGRLALPCKLIDNIEC